MLNCIIKKKMKLKINKLNSKLDNSKIFKKCKSKIN